MNHLDEGTVVSLRDREWTHAEAPAHLRACSSCAAALAEARDRAEGIGRALDALDAPEEPTDLEDVRARIRARLDARSARELRAGARWWSGHLGRAAAMTLIAAGAVSALPGSPVRGWLTATDRSEPAVQEATPAAAQEAETSAVTVAVPTGGMRVIVQSLGPIETLEVVWVDQPTARIDAPTGSRFTYGDGRIEAMVAGGPIRVELPRTGEAVSLEVDGRLYLSRRGEQVEVTGPVGERSQAGILFTAP